MKKIILLGLFSMALLTQKAGATIWTITTPGLSFSPSTVTITLGDTIMFNIGGSHNAVEVSQATWMANGSTSNGGFILPFGGGMYIPTQVKTYYYVCQPHSSSGMKGQIIVNSSTGIPPVDAADKIFYFHPNPCADKTYIHTGLGDGISNMVKVFDVTGKLVLTIQNARNNHVLETGRLNNGIYFVEIRSESYRRTTKLVVED
jgi:plastocyanin